jgi:DNA repair protein RadC
MRKASDIMVIPILDHIIVTARGFLSLREKTIDW